MAVITNPVDLNGNIKVNLPIVKEHAGYAVLSGESHDGVTGQPRLIRPAKVSTDGRLRVGIDNLQWADTFNHTIVDTSAYQLNTATATVAMTGGFLVLNAGNSLVSAAVARVQTYRTFALNPNGSAEVVFRVRFASNPVLNSVCEFGIGFAATTVTPTDGVYFKLNTSGALVGVMNVNGTETTTDPMSSPIAGEVRAYRIVVDQDRLEFYINSNLEGVIISPNTTPAISLARWHPLLIRQYNNAILTTTQRMEISDVSVISRDLGLNRLWTTTMSGMEQGAYNNARGIASGQTSNNVNSTAPVTATLSNTVAGYTTLGGQFQFVATAAAETDYALFAFQVPVASAVGGNRNLVVRGLRLETFNIGAAAGATGTVLQWTLGTGSTGVSLATADSTSVGTRAPRRISLGLQSIPAVAPIGFVATPIDINLDSPIYVSPGTFFHVILKMPAGLATASQIIRGTVLVNGFYE